MGSIPITAGSGTPIRAVSNAGVDSGAYQQVISLADQDGSSLSAKVIPTGLEAAVQTRILPAQVTRYGFNQIFAASPDPANWGVVKAGAGQTASQAASALVLTTGITANSETIIRGLTTFQGALRMRLRSFISQRIANQSFIAELADVIGDNLAITIVSATSVTVTIPNNPFTAASVGQSMYLGGYTGTGTFIPGRYTISAVSGNVVTYTVAGFAAGAGTCSVFGWSYHHIIYDGTVNTTAKWDTQRKGWNNGDSTINTNATASPGHIAAMYQNDLQATIMDGLMATNTGIQFAARGTRVENVPDDIPMYLQIRIVNGSTAPASTTTWTIGQISVSNWAPQDVILQEVRPMAPMAALPVQISNTPTVTANLNGNIASNTGTSETAYFAETTAAALLALIKGGSGNVFELTVSNLTTAVIYVKLYNKVSIPVPSTDTPIMTIPVAAGATLAVEFGVNGKRFLSGIGIGVTAAAVKTDTTAVAAGAQISLSYI